MATQTSIEAYTILRQTGELGERQKQVLAYISDHPNVSYNDISRALNLHHNVTTARIKELRDMGYIVCSGTKIDRSTNKTNRTYRVREDGEEPDDTSSKGLPLIPDEVFRFLRGEPDTEDGVIIVRKNRITYQAERKDGKVSFFYGQFVKIYNVLLACELIEQNRRIVSGVNFSINFRIN